MIVRKYISIKAILRYSGWKIMLMFLHAVAITLLFRFKNYSFLSISALPAGILGTALAILLGFRNNSAYDRWWEAQKMWALLQSESRSFARQVLTFFSMRHSTDGDVVHMMQFQREVIFRHIAFVHALRAWLRREELPAEVFTYIPDDEKNLLKTAVHAPNMLLQKQASRLHEAVEIGYIEDFRHMQIDTRLTAICEAMTNCERIKTTVFPKQYSNYTSIFTWFFILLLPYSFVAELGWLTIPASTLIGFIFMVLETIGYYIETPFENHINDVPITAISKNIERNLLEQLGEKDLPKPVEAVNGYLF